MVFCIIGVERKEDDFKVYECKSFFSYMVAVDYAEKWLENNETDSDGEVFVKIFNGEDGGTFYRAFNEKSGAFILKAKKN